MSPTMLVPTWTLVGGTLAMAVVGSWSLACAMCWWRLKQLERRYFRVDEVYQEHELEEKHEESHDEIDALKNALLVHALVKLGKLDSCNVNTCFSNRAIAPDILITLRREGAQAWFDAYVNDDERRRLRDVHAAKKLWHQYSSTSSSFSGSASDEHQM